MHFHPQLVNRQLNKPTNKGLVGLFLNFSKLKSFFYSFGQSSRSKVNFIVLNFGALAEVDMRSNECTFSFVIKYFCEFFKTNAIDIFKIRREC